MHVIYENIRQYTSKGFLLKPLLSAGVSVAAWQLAQHPTRLLTLAYSPPVGAHSSASQTSVTEYTEAFYYRSRCQPPHRENIV